MREYIFHGKSKETGEWVEGYLNYCPTRKQYYIMGSVHSFPIPVYEESIGQYTEVNEFQLADESYNAKLFEGDIVEVWGWRSVYGREQSQYDKRLYVRGVIRFKWGQWCIDYDIDYNNSIAKPKGSETEERQVHGYRELDRYGYRRENIEKYRIQELEWHRKYRKNEEVHDSHDIKKIGTVFENADLLEG